MRTQRSHITLTPDGRVIVTDNWAATGIESSLKSGEVKVSPRLALTSCAYSNAMPVGIIDYGILHGEEPVVSGSKGTGAIYIHGCPLKCSTCYQPEFFSSKAKLYTNDTALTQLMLDFQNVGVESISLVIATYRADVHQAVKQAKQRGLSIPVVYNYSGMLAPRMLAPLLQDVDIFMPDMKAVSKDLASRHNLPLPYTDIAISGIRFLLESGANVIVRHLIMPSFADRIAEVESIIGALKLEFSNALLSLLIHYMDPATKTISTVDAVSLAALEKIAQEKGVKLYFQGGRP